MENSSLRILLVDDDKDIVELLEYNLVKEGYDVLGLTNPFQVTDSIEQFRPQIVIMDIMMPGRDGFQLCSDIRQSENGKDIPVFFITNREQNLNNLALQNGGDDFIQKFTGLRTLINRVNLVLKKKLIIRKRIGMLTIGKWRLNRETQTVATQSTQISLTDTEFDLFYFLAQNARRSIPIKFLNSVINGSQSLKIQNPVHQSLHGLVKKLGDGFIVFTSEHRVRLNA
jgi:two-component system alkaline phosphatase synthesis response regulator PhoP